MYKYVYEGMCTKAQRERQIQGPKRAPLPTLLSVSRGLWRPVPMAAVAPWFCRYEPKLPKLVSDRLPRSPPESGRVQPAHDAAAVVQLR